MIHESAIRNIRFLVSFILIFGSVAITPKINLDPMNLPKLLVLAIGGFGLLGVFILNRNTIIKNNSLRWINLSLFGFIVSLCIILALNVTPRIQQFYGVAGRNTGFITYFFLAVLFLSSVVLFSSNHTKNLKAIIYLVLLLNIFYGLLQALGKDPFPWNGNFSPVFGFFGNPNFLSAYVGVVFSFILLDILNNLSNPKMLSFLILLAFSSLYILLKTKSQQGLFLIAFELGLLVWIILKRSAYNKFSFFYLLTYLFILIFGILGTLQKGPLKAIFYQTSVTYRGDYWHAGISMFLSRPLQGVGLDGYGDFYRKYRTLTATLRRGPDLVSNASHNVLIDLASNGGLILLLPYMVLFYLTARSCYRIFSKLNDHSNFDLSICFAWLAFTIQSLISINNIGLAIWGWFLGGAVIGVEKRNRNSLAISQKGTDFSGIVASVCAAFGFFVGYQPMNADSNFMHSLQDGNLQQILDSAHKFPQTISRTNSIISVLDANKLGKEAQGVALDAVKQNYRSFEAWKFIYKSNLSDPNLKLLALAKLRDLDPHNPEYRR